MFVLRTESSPTSKCVEVLRKNGSGTNFPEHPFFKRVSPFPAADFKSHLDPGLPGLMDAHLIANDYRSKPALIALTQPNLDDYPYPN